MSKTPYSKKLWILGTIWLLYKDEKKLDKGWRYFFQSHELGLPLAYALEKDFFVDTEKTHRFIESSWVDLCEMLDVDPDENYESMKDMFSKSPNKISA
jgi:hypothetical protein